MDWTRYGKVSASRQWTNMSGSNGLWYVLATGRTKV